MLRELANQTYNPLHSQRGLSYVAQHHILSSLGELNSTPQWRVRKTLLQLLRDRPIRLAYQRSKFIRKIAKERGYKLNQYGIENLKNGDVHVFRSERSIFKFLGMFYITPEDRFKYW